MYFISLHILSRHILSALRKKRQHFNENPSNCTLHHDNATPHTAMETSVTINPLGMEKNCLTPHTAHTLLHLVLCCFCISKVGYEGAILMASVAWSGYGMMFLLYYPRNGIQTCFESWWIGICTKDVILRKNDFLLKFVTSHDYRSATILTCLIQTMMKWKLFIIIKQHFEIWFEVGFCLLSCTHVY